MNVIKNKTKKFTRISKNILVNASKELFKNSKMKKIKKFFDRYKFILIIALIIAIFIGKNIYTMSVYNHQIKALEQEIEKKQAINLQLKEDLQYYNSEEFILRYALEELNMRPTKDSNLFHGEVLPYEDKTEENNSSDNNSSTEDENSPTKEKNTSTEEENTSTETNESSTEEDSNSEEQGNNKDTVRQYTEGNSELNTNQE